ncbi:MAG TPA: phosphatidate cytidylyltransferase [Flavobacteriaceae bacterium]|nr:phosphatidate cytidylyltransferase [Flavobacteriaceae bacterium]
MKEVLTRSLSGLIYITLLILCLNNAYALLVLLFVFGLLTLAEFNKLIQLKAFVPYVVFTLLYLVFGYLQFFTSLNKGITEATQILHVLTVFVQLFLIKDLFSENQIPLFASKRYLLTTFYISSAFVFMFLIANFNGVFTPEILLGTFILIWTNDTFAFLVGKNFGKQKLFKKISPKKTVEGFLGGLFFSCVASYFIATFTETLNFTHWLALSIIICVFGTLGDLIESKFKRQAQVKDSGIIMPGHGGILDRMDSIIFAAPFVYLFLRLTAYVS